MCLCEGVMSQDGVHAVIAQACLGFEHLVVSPCHQLLLEERHKFPSLVASFISSCSRARLKLCKHMALHAPCLKAGSTLLFCMSSRHSLYGLAVED